MEKEKEAVGTSANPAGLEGVVAATSSIGDVDGINGVLIYQGYNIHDLAKQSNFEEVIFLLWNGRLPQGRELEQLKRSLSENQELPREVLEIIRMIPRENDPMDTLRTAISALSAYDKSAHDTSTREANLRTAIKLTAQFPVIVAAIDRIRNGKEPVKPRPDLNLATNFLYCLKGELPSEHDAKIFDVAPYTSRGS
jgi:citrate synthase